ncbi:Endoribonuclease YbeY [Thalassoglobus polymorphus]|uniref:Endoribonuclease YbeY n=2 Tax=Thalassoglobus polymorphus TaxID=2527994 RepID=A0A517QIV9_9PLAN|nr:Endoribonuclease YbeY [Thalassoglobus polymorphus]
MFEIHLSNNQQLLPVHDSLVHDAVTQTLTAQNVASAEIVVALIDDKSIHTVNREHLQHDYPTDVISFLYDSSGGTTDEDSEPLLKGSDSHLDGELVISVETAIRESTTYQWDPLDELRLYIVHGLLHLCGYDDQTDSEKAIMRQREQAILKFWNLTPHYT